MAPRRHALLTHFKMPDRDVDYGVVAALRVLDARWTRRPRASAWPDGSVRRIRPRTVPSTSTPKQIDAVRKDDGPLGGSSRAAGARRPLWLSL